MSDQVERITKLIVGSDMFESRGAARIKVTKDGKARALEIPIKSTGVAEIIERRRKDEPKAPAKPVSVQGDTPLGKELGIPRGQKKTVMAPDYTDADYVAAKEKHDEELAYEIALQGLDVDLVDASDNVVTDRAGKIAALKSLNLSMTQFSDLVSAVQQLTQWSDKERENFFAPASASEETPSA